MKVLDIAFRDMLRSFKSVLAVMVIFIVPLAMVVLMKFLMGNIGGESGFDLPVTQVQVVNLDEGAPPPYGGEPFGQVLVDLLASDELSGLLEVTIAQDEESARRAVDNAEAAVAVIIPADFSRAVYEQEGGTTITLYSDPTLTFGPGLVEGIVRQVLNGFSGSKITTSVVARQFGERGLSADMPTLLSATEGYVDWVMSLNEGQSGGQTWAIQIQSVNAEAGESFGTLIITGIMLAVTIIYVFSTGSTMAQSIVKEQEEGTLQRLFTTPVTLSAILSGKILGAVLMQIAQIAVLVSLSATVFGVNWGHPLPAALAAAGLVMLSSSFGIFVMSLVKNSNQVGAISGGLMTVTGIMGTYPFMIPGVPQGLKTASLAMPQGWAMRALMLARESAALGGDMLLTLAVVVALSIVFFVVGVVLLHRRFE